MTVPSSGPVSASDIINEFGATRDNSSNPNRTRIGDYRRVSSNPNSGSPNFSNYPHNIGELSFSSLDSLKSGGSIPTSVSAGSSSIAFSDFRGTKLQQVVNFYSSGAGGTRLRAYERYSDDGEIGSSEAVTCVGNHKTRPSNSSNTRVHIHVNTSIGSTSKGSNAGRRCALRTGSGWESGTELRIDVGGEGRIQGAGGDGGNGSTGAGGGGNGEGGSSGLGIQYGTDENKTVVSIASGGIIRCGYGGGGGGGGANDVDYKSNRTTSGGGGGGGAGLPGGHHGEGGTKGGEGNGSDGEEGTANAGGEGGNGRNSANEAVSGKGGDGGDTENFDAEAGVDGQGGEESGGEGGEPGGNGAAIRKTNNNIKFEFEEGSSIPSSSGSTSANNVL
jgi:hypothetical protein